MSYAGIDYSLGRSNFNPETGIHFGVISQHSIAGEALGDIEPHYTASCPKCGNTPREVDAAFEAAHDDWDSYEERGGCRDYACEVCKHFLDNESVWPEEPDGLSYGEDGYNITDCLDSDLFVIESPFYTFAQYCSPCVPGAGNLDNPCETGPKSYCLGHDWFENEVAPYPVYRVSDGQEVVAVSTLRS
jgi:hypothetical protein